MMADNNVFSAGSMDVPVIGGLPSFGLCVVGAVTILVCVVSG